MDLYEALRNGTSEEDLLKTFTEELAAAKQQIEDEDHDTFILDSCRRDAAEALLNYFCVLYDDNDMWQEEYIELLERTLENMELTITDSTPEFGLLKRMLNIFDTETTENKNETRTLRTSPWSFYANLL